MFKSSLGTKLGLAGKALDNAAAAAAAIEWEVASEGIPDVFAGWFNCEAALAGVISGNIGGTRPGRPK